jgi:RecA/RadA recombinase
MARSKVRDEKSEQEEKKDKKILTRAELLDHVHKYLRDNEGAVWVPANQLTNVHEERLDTGIFGLNWRTNGGYPAATNVTITGEPNVGKDLTVNYCLAALQRNKGSEANAAFINNEGEYDKNFGRLVGCRFDWTDEELDRLEEQMQEPLPKDVRKAMKHEGVGNADFITAQSTEDSLNIVLELLASGLYDLICLNSVDGLISSDALEGMEKEGIEGAGKGRGGEGRARLLSEFFRARNALMSEPYKTRLPSGTVVDTKRKTVNFFITQWRIQHLGPQITRDKQMSGGWPLKFWSSVILEMTRVPGEETYIGSKDPRAFDHVKTSHLINYYVQKGKHGVVDGPNVQVRYYKHDHPHGDVVLKAGTLDEAETVRAALMEFGWLTQHGSKGYSLHIPEADYEPATDLFIEGGRFVVDEEIRVKPELYQLLKRRLTEHVVQASQERNAAAARESIRGGSAEEHVPAGEADAGKRERPEKTGGCDIPVPPGGEQVQDPQPTPDARNAKKTGTRGRPKGRKNAHPTRRVSKNGPKPGSGEGG